MFKKFTTTLILISILTLTVSGVLIVPKKANAFEPAAPVAEVGPSLWKQIWDKAYTLGKDALKVVGDVAYQNGLRYFLSKVAYDTASYIATGDKGGKPLFVTNWKKYFQQTADEAAGVFFEKLSVGGKGHCENNPNRLCTTDNDCGVIQFTNSDGTKDEAIPESRCIGVWSGIGIDLCDPIDPLAKLTLTVSAKKSLEPRKPRCNWSQIRKNLEDLRDLSFDELVEFRTIFDPSANDLGAYVTIRTAIDERTVAEQKKANLLALINSGFKDVESDVSGDVKTPASGVKKAFEVSYDQSFEAQKTYTGSPVADAIGVFTNTLVSKLLQRVFNKGFNPAVGGSINQSEYWTIGGKAAAKLFFGELAEVNYRFDSGIMLNELISDSEGQFNNFVNDKFIQAIENKCTVGQAINFYSPTDDAYRTECANLLSDMAPFGFDKSGNEPSVGSGIPYRSILVLRKFRVVPVGWELAAKYYKEFGNRGEQLNLKFLVENYKIKDSPYYGLVDPDWILKFPLTRCAKEGASAIKISQDPYCNGEMIDGVCSGEIIYPFQRVDTCADYETCLFEDANGNCDENNWGYCVEEKPVWKIDGEECSKKYYATCSTMINTENNEKISYLLNTVDGFADGICNDFNVGCNEYCDLYNPRLNKWECSSSDAESEESDGSKVRRILLNSSAENCSAENEGCSLVYIDVDANAKDVQEAYDIRLNDNNAYNLLKREYVKMSPDYYVDSNFYGLNQNCEGYTTLKFQNDAGGSVATPEFCGKSGYYWREDIKACVESGSEECKNFVKYCQAKDVSCNLYTPQNSSSPAVPAKIERKDCLNASSVCSDDLVENWNDECPASCVGYTTYHQSATTFESGKDDNFIAETATRCTSPGCDEFTNLDEVAKGGEGIEYYSYLRQCIKPDEENAGVFYSWEGSDGTSDRLRKWELKQGIDGGPFYLDGGKCDDDPDDGDCMEFFDKNLDIYHRYFSKTVSVSENCHPFRRSVDQEIYNAIPDQGIKCNESNKLCREYRTSESYNTQEILSSSFSNQTDSDGWIGGILNDESLRRGDYSLKSDTKIEHDLYTGDLEAGSNYIIEFLAKGSGKIRASFTGGAAISSDLSQDLSAIDWQVISLRLPSGNVGLTNEQAENNRVEITSIGGEFYIDNIIVKKLNAVLLIKNSWKTPEICTELSGNFENEPNIREHLNCQAYKDENNKKINLRSFGELCMEDVVGCQKVIDANNTLRDKSDDMINYLVLSENVFCSENAIGCTRLAKMTLSLDEEVEYNFTEAYKIVDKTQLQDFCNMSEVGCQKYQDLKDNNKYYYFKDPSEKTCEFKKINENLIGAWYKTGTEELCPETEVGSCLGGSLTSAGKCTNLAYPNEEGLFTDWVGVCEENSSGCREYQDPSEPTGCDKNLQNFELTTNENQFQCNYYYYKNVETCGSVNPDGGCAGFYSTFKKEDGEKSERSYKVCSNTKNDNEPQECETDIDCSAGARCEY